MDGVETLARATETSESSVTDQIDYEERITALQKSLADVRKLENLKHRTGHLLAHAELMFDVLESIKGIHPFIGVAVLPFMATLKITLTKQDNDRRIIPLMIEMIDMMSPLTELRNMKAPNRKTATDETVQKNLDRVLTDAKNDIEEAGNLVDCFMKARTLHKVLHAQKWSEKFKDTAETFQRRKTNIIIALGTHTALEVDTLRPKMDYVIEIMDEWFKRPQSVEERRVLDKVNQVGGVENEAAFIELYKETGPGEKTRKSASSMTTDSRKTEPELVREAKAEWEDIKQSLTILLNGNRSQYAAKMEIQTRELTTVIRQSETTVLKAINQGPYVYIKHPDLKHLWKAMNWRLSVKTRHFVMALHDYYLYGAGWAVPTPYASQNASSSNFNLSGPLVDPLDKWCLQYLEIRYLPALSEAFDDDGSGFIRISEANDFTDGIPKDWNILKWIAYWTAGWSAELGRYSHLIQETMAQISEAQCQVRPENMGYVNDYITGLPLAEMRLLVTAIEPRATTSNFTSELSRLTEVFRERTERDLEENLKTVKYYIDEPGVLTLLGGPGRIEKYLFPLLHLLIKRHLDIVRFASVHPLDPREMYDAYCSLDNVFWKVWQRVAELKESFRQQKLDVNVQFKNYACGMYSRFHQINATKWMGLTPQHPGYIGYETLPGEFGPGPGDEESSSKVKSEDLDPLSQDEPNQPDSPNSQILGIATPTESDMTSGLTPAAPLTVIDELTASSQCEENRPVQESDLSPPVDRDRSARADGPTRFPPFCVDTTSYAQPSTLTEDTAPWRPLRVSFSDIGPREMFKMAALRVVERVQLLSPRMTWDYLQRRRSIRLKWVDISLRGDQEYVGISVFRDRVPSNEEELEDLTSQITPADVEYFNSLVEMQTRLQRFHAGFCDGCHLRIFGKRFRCLNCPDFDLCNDCEYAEIPKHDVIHHPPSHTMIQYTYPLWGLPRTAFEGRAQKYMVKHSKLACPCNSAEKETDKEEMKRFLICGGCEKKMRNEVHFRCLQCPNLDLCEACEQDQPSKHCIAHALLKLKAPFMAQSTDLEHSDNSSESDEEESLSVETRLTKLAQRMNSLETKFGTLKKDLTRVISLLEGLGTQDGSQTHKYEPTKMGTP